MELGFHSTQGLLLTEKLKTIPKKSKNSLQPLFEAIINSFGAIETLNKSVLVFYEKNGFFQNVELFNKDR